MGTWTMAGKPRDQAVEILDADEAHENFAKTFSFLQEGP